MAVLYIGQTLAGAAVSSAVDVLSADHAWPVLAVLLSTMLVTALLPRFPASEVHGLGLPGSPRKKLLAS